MKSSKPIFEDFFSFRCRRNALSYAISCLTLLFLSIVLVLMGYLSDVYFAAEGEVTSLASILLVSGLFLPLLLLYTFSVPQRLRDLGYSGWWTLCVMIVSLIPLLNLGVSLWLLFAKGTQGENKYGPDPLGPK